MWWDIFYFFKYSRTMTISKQSKLLYIFSDLSGLSYYGIKLNILSTCLIFIFSLFPADLIKNKYFLKFLKISTNYSSGVYYLHREIRNYLRYYIKDIKYGTFNGSIYFILLKKILNFKLLFIGQ